MAQYDPEVHMVLDDPYSAGYHSQVVSERVHITRDTIGWALETLAAGKPEKREEAFAAVRQVISLQDTRSISPTYGVWPWYLEEPLDEMDPADQNWADFISHGLLRLVHRHQEIMPEELVEACKQAMFHAAHAIFRRNVDSGYTNICTLGAAVAGGVGELLELDWLVEYAADRIEKQADDAESAGAVPEFNSPTYYPVVVEATEAVLAFCQTDRLREHAERLRQWIWEQIARAFHPGTREWGGPYARAYYDTLLDRQKAWLGRRGVAPFAYLGDPGIDSGEVLPCPEELRQRFISLPGTLFTERLPIVKPGDPSLPGDRGIARAMDTRHCMTSVTLSHTWAQTRPLLGHARSDSGQTAVFRNRVYFNGLDFASGCVRQSQQGFSVLSIFGLATGQGIWHGNLDRPEDGQFDIESLRFVYELHHTDAVATAAGKDRFLLEADGRQIEVRVGPAEMAGQPATWRCETGDGCASVYCERDIPPDDAYGRLEDLGPTYAIAGCRWLVDVDQDTEPIQCHIPGSALPMVQADWHDGLSVTSPTIATTLKPPPVSNDMRLHRLAPVTSAAIRFLQENYAQTVDLTEVSIAAGVSSAYLSRRFRIDTGRTLTDYLHELRVDRAKKLLQTTQDTVATVGQACGFENAEHFHRIFKRHAGITPSRYRKQRPSPKPFSLRGETG